MSATAVQMTAVCNGCGDAFEHVTSHHTRPHRYCSDECRRAGRSRSLKVPWQERFWDKADKSAGPTGCWEWTGMRNAAGYGKIATDRRSSITAHRASYLLTHGTIPDGLHVCHECDNPPCVNPAHLFLGTHDDNMRDMARKGRVSTRRGMAHHNARVPWETVQAIRAEHAAGATGVELAARYGVTGAYISAVVRFKARRDA